ncbi:hypothetical protein N7495_005723 [Penicillium taxi]|uniref:uncharacterized protein n=1 Tax=Penicillium taxi TaxID=168475 RepID=UPI002545005E|nr:uncharacterized protein N7495_005723 [Penicillium taxi]KAJ5894032.1 hypothetical protein N7495_005723 [Penicillium taxi]
MHDSLDDADAEFSPELAAIKCQRQEEILVVKAPFLKRCSSEIIVAVEKSKWRKGSIIINLFIFFLILLLSDI